MKGESPYGASAVNGAVGATLEGSEGSMGGGSSNGNNDNSDNSSNNINSCNRNSRNSSDINTCITETSHQMPDAFSYSTACFMRGEEKLGASSAVETAAAASSSAVGSEGRMKRSLQAGWEPQLSVVTPEASAVLESWLDEHSEAHTERKRNKASNPLLLSALNGDTVQPTPTDKPEARDRSNTSDQEAGAPPTPAESDETEKPEAARRLRFFVGGIAQEVEEHELEALFSNYGRVHSVQLTKDYTTGRRRGFGFVTMGEATAESAIFSAVHYLRGRRLDVRRENETTPNEINRKVFVGGLPPNLGTDELAL